MLAKEITHYILYGMKIVYLIIIIIIILLWFHIYSVSITQGPGEYTLILQFETPSQGLPYISQIIFTTPLKFAAVPFTLAM